MRYSNKRGQRLPVCTGLFGQSKKKRGKLSKVVATVTSLIVIGLMHCSGGQLSVVS